MVGFGWRTGARPSIEPLIGTMTGFLADADLTENAIEAARRATKGYIDLTSSNPTHQGLLFPPDALRAAAEPYWSARRYEPDPKGRLDARAAIADYLESRFARTSPLVALETARTQGRQGGHSPSRAIAPDDVVVTASTSEAYSLLFALLTEPGDNVLGPDVTYPLFEHLAQVHHVELRTYHLDEGTGWQIDPASVLAAADARTRAALIVSPHNPTGMVVQRPIPALTALGVPVISDEVFAEFPYRVAHAPPLGALHPELPVFHLDGISKHLALPDLKLGWIAMNDPAATRFGQRLEFLNDAFLSANALTQAMLPALLAGGAEFVAAMRQRVRASLDQALATLAACPSVRVQPPDGGYYLFPEVLGWDDEEALVLHLLAHGVLAHPGFYYGSERGAHLMISCLTEPARLAEGLERLARALR